MISRAKSEALFAESLKHIPGGVNSPVRAFRGVGGQPFFAERAAGSHVWDVDGNEYIDYVGTWGPAILGHANPTIIQAVKDAAENGTSFGIPNEHEVRMAQLVKECVPSGKSVRRKFSGLQPTVNLRLSERPSRYVILDKENFHARRIRRPALVSHISNQ